SAGTIRIAGLIASTVLARVLRRGRTLGSAAFGEGLIRRPGVLTLPLRRASLSIPLRRAWTTRTIGAATLLLLIAVLPAVLIAASLLTRGLRPLGLRSRAGDRILAFLPIVRSEEKIGRAHV